MLKPIQARFSINLVENSSRELLLLKRHKKAGLGPGLWGFPAGHIKKNETPEFCSIRELNEEIGCEHKAELMRKLGPMRDTFYGGIYEVYLFHYHWRSGIINLNYEHTHYAWVSAENYKNYPVMKGLDEDIAWLDIWPRKFLNSENLPEQLK